MNTLSTCYKTNQKLADAMISACWEIASNMTSINPKYKKESWLTCASQIQGIITAGIYMLDDARDLTAILSDKRDQATKNAYK